MLSKAHDISWLKTFFNRTVVEDVNLSTCLSIFLNVHPIKKTTKLALILIMNHLKSGAVVVVIVW
jgi:hypothetical protein